jgi:hypothetical protein
VPRAHQHELVLFPSGLFSVSAIQISRLLPHSMGLPPGPPFLCRLTLRNLPTTMLWYGIFLLFVFYLEIATPTWLAILVALSTQLMFLIAVGRWRVYRGKRDAAAKGAVSVPQVQEGGLSIIAAIMDNLSSGYPCGCCHSRSCSLSDIRSGSNRGMA